VSQAQLDALRAPGGRRSASLFSPEERAVLRFTDHLTTYPGNIDAEDVEQLQAHFSEEQVVELVIAIATTNWTNRINDGLQTPLG
jgi:alkylhydroperoxidase family enzyme